MAIYRINATNTSSETGTIEPDVGFHYTDKLNEANEGEIKISGLGSIRQGLLVIGSTIDIYKDDVLDFKGKIDNIDNLEGGGFSFHITGFNEFWLAKENGDYASSPWKATASATIFAALIAESNYVSAGTVNAGLSIDYRANLTDSLFNAISNLATKTGQDVAQDYANAQIDILDHKGSTTSVMTLNDSIDIRNIRFSQAYPSGNDIRVYGKGDGVDQIKSNPSTSGQDATSKSTYGTIRKPVIDRSIMSVSEANQLADVEVARSKDPTKIYDFDVINVSLVLVSGDVITLNARSQGLTNEAVRITGIERGVIGGIEYMTMQVSNAAYGEFLKKRNEVLSQIYKRMQDSDTYMQGSGNTLTFGGIRNANSTTGMSVVFNLPSSFITDEAGNIRVDSFTLDYDVDKFNSQFGGATFDGTDPQVQNSSANTAPDVAGNSNNNGDLSIIVSADNATTASTLGNSFTEVDTAVIAGGNNGQYIVFNLNTFVVDHTAAGTSAFSIWARVYDGTNYYPDTTGIRLCRGVIDYAFSRTTSSSGDHSHGTGSDAGNNSFMLSAECDTWDACRTATDTESTHTHTVTDTITIPFNGSGCIICPVNPAGKTFSVQLRETFGSGSANVGLNTGYQVHSRHLHGSGTYAAASHPHADGTYDILATDLDNISIGDGVGEAGSVNATEVTIYLEFWNGSAWITKHTIASTGKTLDTDVDVTNSGTYPDAAGFWRVRIVTDSASADLVQAVAKLKHNLDN